MRRIALVSLLAVVAVAVGLALGGTLFLGSLRIVDEALEGDRMSSAAILAVLLIFIALAFGNAGWQMAYATAAASTKWPAMASMKWYVFSPLCAGRKGGCLERIQRECEIARGLGYVAGANEVSRRHLEQACERFERDLASRRAGRERTDH